MIATLLIVLFAVMKTSGLSMQHRAPTTVPIALRECSTQSFPVSLVQPFASWLSTQPPSVIQENMGLFQLRHDINGTCMQVQIYNWSCDHNLTVTGPNIANAVASIAEQCAGKVYSSGETAGPGGFGYYKDLESGDDYTQHLWVVSSLCGDGRRKSACSPGA